MVDLVSIGVSGLSAYQRALATTSNNIANLQTEGYVRQRAVLQTAGQDNSSRISLGNGVQFAEVQRLYDRFAEENLQRATSDLKGEEALLKELQSLQDALGSSEAGLHGAFQAFFDAARALEAAPASTGVRAGFLASAEGVAARFRGLGGTASNLDRTTQAQIEQSVGEVNSLLQEIASLNGQLVKRTTDSEQPMQLLDRRDAVLKSLSEKIGVTVQFSNSGAATVYAGDSASGVALVENVDTRTLSVQFDPVDYGKVQFVLDAASRPVVLPTVRTGTLGGLVSFRGQALGPAAERLDTLALAFGREVNRLHKEGLDSLGRAGTDLFYTGPDFVIDGRANAGNSRLGVDVINATNVQSNSYSMRFSAASGVWTVTNDQTQASTTGTQEINLDGLRFSLQGTPRDGDTYRVTPTSRPALAFRTLIKDPAEVAGASKLMSSVAPTNLSATSADVALVSPRTATSQALIDSVIPRSNGTTIESTLVAARSTPIAVIPAGYGDVALSSSIGGGELAIFTRDGRQLAGPDLSVRATDIVSSANGFYAGAIFSAEYLNKTGEDAYLDHGFIFGQVASSSSQLDSAGNAQLTPATIVTDTVNGAAIATDGRLRVRINGESIDVAVAGSDLATIAAAINTQKVATGAVAEVIAVAETSVPAGNVVAGSSIKLTNAANTLVTISVDSRLGETDKSWAQNLARKINAANLGITATITGANLVLSKVSASDGTTFSVGANSIGMTTGAVDERSKLMFKSYQDIRFDTGAVDDNSFIYLNNQFDSSFGDHGITVDPVGSRPAGESAAQNLVRKINDAQLGVTASIDGTKIVLTNSAGQAGMPFTIGRNSLGLEEKTHFNDADLSIDFDPTVTTTQSLKNLGLRPGFVMREALGEDLLVFGVDASSGRASSVSISGSYSAGSPPAALATDTREYEIVFDATNGYEVIDSATETVVSAGVFDLTNRTISYGVWKTTFGGIPAGGDRFIIKPTVDALGDNRTASLIAQIQSRRDLLPSKQTLQEEYEGLVNRIGSLTVQAEIGQNAQKVVYDHAQQSRDRVSGVNLDEELSDLLRFQQAYQANAQVIQTANRIFDSLLQRL